MRSLTSDRVRLIALFRSLKREHGSPGKAPGPLRVGSSGGGRRVVFNNSDNNDGVHIWMFLAGWPLNHK
jgi:hypothetical protein